MSYEYRRPILNFSGVLSAAVSNTDTTLTSSAFVGLPTDYSTATPGTYLPLVLADDAAGKLEVVWVTGHSSGSSSVTVVRGREGTTALGFSAGNIVRCSATTWDLSPVVVADRASLPTPPFAGMRALILSEAAIAEYLGAVRKWSGDVKLKHRWRLTGGTLIHDSDVVVNGLALSGSTGDIATIAAGVCTLNKPGHWFLSWSSITDHNQVGWLNHYFSWPSGPMVEPVEQQMHRAAVAMAGGGQMRSRITWSGYVSPSQAAAPFTPYIHQKNTAATSITGVTADLVAEYLGS